MNIEKVFCGIFHETNMYRLKVNGEVREYLYNESDINAVVETIEGILIAAIEQGERCTTIKEARSL